jgi:hypothetical protein
MSGGDVDRARGFYGYRRGEEVVASEDDSVRL